MPVTLYATPLAIEVIQCVARFIGLFAGRRWGKTLGVIIPLIIKTACEHPGARVAYIAPSHKLTKQMFRLLQEKLRPLIKRSDAQFPFVLELWNGSQIDFYSFKNPASIRGSGYDLVVFDEIQEVKDPDIFDAVIRPLLSDRKGKLIVAGQFRGQNWYYKKYCVGGGLRFANNEWSTCEARTNYKAFVFESHSGPVFQTAKGKAELADAQETLPRVIYEQEYLCKPIANQAAVFHPFDLTACTRGALAQVPASGKKYVAGVDIGAHRDQGALIITEIPSLQVVHAEGLPLGMKHADIAAKIAPTIRRFRALPVVDVTGGATGGHAPVDTYVQYYRQQLPDMRPHVWTRDNKQYAVRALAHFIEQRKVGIPAEARQLLEELGLFEYEARPWGYDYHGPKGQRDNLVMGFALCIVAFDRGWITTTTGVPLSSVLY